jgi:hypothetical protein
MPKRKNALPMLTLFTPMSLTDFVNISLLHFAPNPTVRMAHFALLSFRRSIDPFSSRIKVRKTNAFRPPS